MDSKIPDCPFEAARRGDEPNQGFGLMGIQLIGDENPGAAGVAGHGLANMLSKVSFGAGGLNGRRDDPAGGHFQVGDQGLRAVADILEFTGFRGARPPRPGRRRPF